MKAFLDDLLPGLKYMSMSVDDFIEERWKSNLVLPIYCNGVPQEDPNTLIFRGDP